MSNKEQVLAMPSTNAKKRMITMKKVENGFTVNVSWDTPDKYVEKIFVAKNKDEAKKLANKYL